MLIALAERSRQRLVGRSWIWRAERVPRTYADTDLLIMETDEPHCRRAGVPGDFFIPLWVDGQLPCTRLNMAAPGTSLGDDLRKVGKHGYGYEISHDPARLVMYHERMYLPYIQRVHGDRAALAALCYFRMLQLRKRGYDRLNAGASRAFLRDGALQ